MKAIIEIGENGFWKERQTPKSSLDKAAILFNEIDGNIIIEIGSGIQGEMSGNSVLTWAEKTQAKKIICLDLDQKHVDEVVAATKGYPVVEAIKQDGLKFLKKYTGEIDLLYLDFWVQDKKGELIGTARAEYYLKAFNHAKTRMSNSSIILIDDTDHVDPWKQTYIIPEARKYGYNVLWIGRQTCLFRNR